jgi:hypothetical protein
MNAFITGSRVYGQARSDSDIDLVILVDCETKSLLAKFGADEKGTIRFGCLNIIAVETPTEFAAWKVATAQMVYRKNTTGEKTNREDAIKLIDSLMQPFGCRTDSPSGEKQIERLTTDPH